MNSDTGSFLETLLWLNEGTESDCLDGDPTIWKFTPEFTSAVDGFISGFREYLENQGFDIERLDYLERSFGGNVLFSLSGHGCGFYDEYGDPEKTLGDELQAHVKAYSGNGYRFEGLEYNLAWTDGGKIDLAFQTEHLAEQRAKLFSVAQIPA